MKQIRILETLGLISDAVNMDKHKAHKQELFGVVNNFYKSKEVLRPKNFRTIVLENSVILSRAG